MMTPSAQDKTDKPNKLNKISRLQAFLVSDPENYPLLCDLADQYLQSEGQGKALARPLLERAMQLRPQDHQARYQMAVLDFFEQRLEESLALTGALLAEGERSPAIGYQHACTLIQLSRHDEAEPILKALLQSQLSVPDLPALYVRSLHFQGKLEEAEAFARQAVAQAPQDAVMHGMLSLLLLDQDKLEDARAVATQALLIQPDNMDALVVQGSALLAYEDPDSATQLFSHAVEISPNNGRAWLGLGLGEMMRGNLPTAQSRMQSAVAHMPDHLGTWNTLAWTQILQNDFEGATKTLNDCLKVNDKFGETWGSLAVVAALTGQWEEAGELYKKAVRLQPESFAGRYAQSLVMAHRGHPERSEAMIQGILNNFAAPGGGTLADMARRFVARQRSH